MAISEDELQIPRLASEFLPWVESRINEIALTENGKSAIRLRIGLAKQLLEELYPLGLFAFHHYKNSPEVTVTPVLGNQNYDATVNDKRQFPSPFEYIEVTQSHEGENEHLRMLVLERDGHVNPIGPVTKSGNRAVGMSIIVENVARLHSDILADELFRIEEAVLRKMDKTYPAGTALVIAIDDHILFHLAEDIEALKGTVSKYLKKLIAFRWIAFVGWSKRIYLEYDLF